MGQQRSAMVVVCYLMKYLKMNLNDSIKEVKIKRKYSFLPEITFEDLLIRMEGVYEIVEVTGDFKLKWICQE